MIAPVLDNVEWSCRLGNPTHSNNAFRDDQLAEQGPEEHKLMYHMDFLGGGLLEKFIAQEETLCRAKVSFCCAFFPNFLIISDAVC
jgi:hypothetical protein